MFYLFLNSPSEEEKTFCWSSITPSSSNLRISRNIYQQKLQIFITKVKFLIEEAPVEGNFFKQNHKKLKNLLLKWSLEITSIYLYLIRSGFERINDILKTKK